MCVCLNAYVHSCKCLLFQHSTEINSFGYFIRATEKTNWLIISNSNLKLHTHIDRRSITSQCDSFIHIPMLWLVWFFCSLCCWRFESASSIALILSSKFIIYWLVVVGRSFISYNCSIGWPMLVNCTPAAAAAWDLH